MEDDEVLRLHEQSIAITERMEGSSSVNIAVTNRNLAIAYYKRSKRARAANDLDREMANLEKALPLFAEAARIYRAANDMGSADTVAQSVVKVEEAVRRCTAAKVAATATATATAEATTGRG